MSPAALDFVVRRCFAKDPDERWQTARDLASQLEWIAQGGSQIATTRNPTHVAGGRRRERLAWITATLVSVLWLATSIAMGFFLGRVAEEREVRFEILTPGLGNPSQVSVSPDGRLVVFQARASSNMAAVLWVRPLNSTVAQPLGGTEGALQPFWSPDSRHVGFGADGKLKRIDVAGGPPQTICDALTFSGGTWNREGVIVFSTNTALNRVAAAGGQPVSIMEVDDVRQETSLRWPFFLPDGRHFLYLSQSSALENRAIHVGSLDSTERTRLISANSMMAYAHPGYVVFHRNGVLMAQPFDAQRLQIDGDAFRVADDISFNPDSGRAGFGVSDSGVLLYRTGVGGATRQLRWFDRTGGVLSSVGEPGPISQVALSPDEKRIAVVRQDVLTATNDIWLLELSSNIPTRLTLDSANENDPVWSPDGEAVAFNSNRNGANDFYQRTLGDSHDTLLFESPDTPKYVEDWSRDGKFLLYLYSENIFALPLMGDRKPMRLTQTPFTKNEPHFSPNGRWVAYNSDESGATEVFVASFPAFENRKQVSARGGGAARWRVDGRELFYMSTDGNLMSVAVKPGSNLEFGVPTRLFQTPIVGPALTLDQYAVTGDGQRFLILSPTESAASEPITVVLNWTSLLKQ